MILFHFKIYGSDKETEIGAVNKKYRGYIAEALTSADEFKMQCKKNQAERER